MPKRQEAGSEEEVWELEDVRPFEVSLVDAAANKRRWILFKSHETPEDGSMDERTIEILKALGLEPESQEGRDLAPLIEKLADRIDSPERAATVLAAMGVEVKQAEGEGAPAGDGDGLTDLNRRIEKLEKAAGSDDSGSMQLALETLKSARQEILQGRERADRLEADILKEREIRLQREYLEKARDLPFLPGETSELAQQLRSIDRLPEAEAESLRQLVHKAHSRLKESDRILKTVGHHGSGDPAAGASASVHNQLIQKAREIEAAEGLTFEVAFEKAMDRNPSLQRQYREAIEEEVHRA